MKRIIPILILCFILAAFLGTLWFLYRKSQQKPVIFETERPVIMDIVKKTVATGALLPREEIEIKPRVSGIVESLHVEPGDVVEKGQLIAKIAIVPNIANLNRAEAQVEAARISFESAKRELERTQGLHDRQVISGAELERRRVDFELRKQELDTAQSELQIVRKGAAKKSAKAGSDNTEVRTTVAGKVLELPVKEGGSVIESNTFNPGTTVAVVADMSDMIFQGQVDESEVGRLETGMELDIKVGALDNEVLKGRLEYIAPKGVEAEGVIQFEVKARLLPTDKPVTLRAGYSANADIVLERRTQVLAVEERLVQFAKDKQPYVEVEVADQVFERRDIKVGLSDGIHIQIEDGIDKDARIKKP